MSTEIRSRGIIAHLVERHRAEHANAAALRSRLGDIGKWLSKYSETIHGVAIDDALDQAIRTRKALAEAEDLAADCKALAIRTCHEQGWELPPEFAPEPIEAAARAAVPEPHRAENGHLSPSDTVVDGAGEEADR